MLVNRPLATLNANAFTGNSLANSKSTGLMHVRHSYNSTATLELAERPQHTNKRRRRTERGTQGGENQHVPAAILVHTFDMKPPSTK